MDVAAVTGRSAQSKLGITRSTRLARNRSTRGLSIRQSKNRPIRTKISRPTRIRLTGRTYSSPEFLSFATAIPRVASFSYRSRSHGVAAFHTQAPCQFQVPHSLAIHQRPKWQARFVREAPGQVLQAMHHHL